jgi:hypothetical protein
VNDKPCGQIASACDNCLAGFTATLACNDLPAFFQNCRATGSMYGAVYPTAAHQRRICSIHDGIDLLCCYVAPEQLKFRYPINHNAKIKNARPNYRPGI